MPDLSVNPVRAFQDNYVWTLRLGGNAAVVDPGEAGPVLAYLRAHKDHVAIHKLRMNRALTTADLEELEREYYEKNGLDIEDLYQIRKGLN